MSIKVFADASRKYEYGQLGTVVGLLIGEIDAGSFFHTLSWSSHSSTRHIKSIGAAEILAARETVDGASNKIKVLAIVYKALLRVDVEFLIALDSKDLFGTLPFIRNP